MSLRLAKVKEMKEVLAFMKTDRWKWFTFEEIDKNVYFDRKMIDSLLHDLIDSKCVLMDVSEEGDFNVYRFADDYNNPWRNSRIERNKNPGSKRKKRVRNPDSLSAKVCELLKASDKPLTAKQCSVRLYGDEVGGNIQGQEYLKICSCMSSLNRVGELIVVGKEENVKLRKRSNLYVYNHAYGTKGEENANQHRAKE